MVPNAIDELRERMTHLAAAIDDVFAFDLTSLDDREILDVTVDQHRLQQRAEALTTRFVAAVDAFGDTGRATTQSWFAYATHLPKGVARGVLTRSRALKDMPATDDAYAAGDINRDHVRTLAAACRANPKAFAKAEDELLHDARTRRFDQFARSVDYFRQVADPDGVETEAVDAYEQRNLHCSETFENTVRIDGSLDPLGGHIVKNELERLEQQLFDADWREARGRLGDAATAKDLRRTSEQRRADSLVEMARRSAAMPADAKQARVLLTVLVGYETFAGRMCQLANGAVVTPGQLVSLFPDLPVDIDVERAVFSGPSRLTDLGRRQRLFVGGARRAVQLAHLECTDETCDVPYERCETDHIQPWAHGGPTNQNNGRLRCPRHHPGRRRIPRTPEHADTNDEDHERETSG